MRVSYFQRANQLKQEGKLKEAIASYQQAIKQNPNFYCSHHNLGETLAQLGRWQEAVNSYQRAIEIKATSAWSHHNLGEALVKLGRWEEAIASYQKAIELSPNVDLFQKSLKEALSKTQDFDKETVEDEGKNSEILSVEKKAIVAGDRKGELSSTEADKHYRLGQLLAKENQLLEAIFHYKEAIALNPDLEDTKIDLINLLIKYVEAEETQQISPQLEAHLGLGKLLVEGGKLEEAIEIYQQAIALKPDYRETYLLLTEAHMKMSYLFYDRAQLYESLESFQKAIEIYQKQLEAHPLGNLGIRFITPEYFTGWPWLGAIGHLGMNLDIYFKIGIMGWRPAYHTILLTPAEEVGNQSLLDYWRSYLHVICDPSLIEGLLPLAKAMRCLEYTAFHFKLTNKKVVDVNYVASAAQKQWEEEGRSALLKLSSSDYRRGWHCLEELGVPKDAWFVCLHVREDAFRPEGVASHRSAELDTYLLAIKTIVDRGGWVIRVGDSSMKPLPPMKQVIDYARSNAKSDWMDVFLCASCRFFLGTNSGLNCVAWVFGVPCALTNMWPISARGVQGQDLFIPKLGWSETEGRYLSFEEAMGPRFFFNLNSKLLYSWGIKVIDNTPEEINELVLEMLDRLEGKLEYSEEDELLQKRFNSIPTPYGPYLALSRLGRSFARARKGDRQLW